jgi:Tfp pilus assembly PilM family ATPase/Tfp pilus assembly protein PilN
VIIEIGNDWLKIVQTEPSRKGLAISRIHLEKFDSFGRNLSQAIVGAFKKQGFDKLPVIACLPRQLVNIRMLELPSTDADEIASMADIQVAKQTPYSRDEIVFDYKIMEGGRTGYTKVMMAIVQDSVVRDRFHILEDAGIEVERMTVSTEGLLNWYAWGLMVSGDAAGTVAMLDVDSFYSDFMVVTDGALISTRSILMGTNQLIGAEPESLNKFALEVKRCRESCQGESPSLNIGRVFLTGAGPNIKDINNTLKDALSIPVISKDSMQLVTKMPKTVSMTDPAYRGVSLTGIVGAGIATSDLEFNLTPDSVKLRKSLEDNARTLTVLGMLVMAVLVSFSVYGTSILYLKKGRALELKTELNRTERSAHEIVAKQEIFNEVKKRQDSTYSMVSILSEIHGCLPSNVFLDSLDVNVAADKDQVRLIGTGATSADVSALIKNLEQSHLLKDAKEEGARVKDKTSGKYSFKAVCSLETTR